VSKNRYMPDSAGKAEGNYTALPVKPSQYANREYSNEPPPKQEPKVAPKPWEVKPQKIGVVPDTITAADLVKIEYPPPQWLVTGLLGEGLTLCCGKSKEGKSWLSLQLAFAIAGGLPMCGRESVQGDVLYFSLEDTRRRLQSRVRKFEASYGKPAPSNLFLSTRAAKSHEGGIAQIAEWLLDHKATAKLVIIDTLGRFRETQKGKSNGFAEDYEAIAVIKELIDHFGVSCLVIHHTRKLPSEDPFDAISGTNALGAAADSMWVLERIRGQADAKLFTTGRDADESTIPMTWDKPKCFWQVAANREGIEVDETGRGGRGKSESNIQQCKVWLKEFLREYAYPDRELKKAAEVAGFNWTCLRDSKTELGKSGTGELSNKNFGGGGKDQDWWVGLGPWQEWKHRPGSPAGQPDTRNHGGTEPRNHRRDLDGPPDRDEGF
jgi:hypothetical protein